VAANFQEIQRMRKVSIVGVIAVLAMLPVATNSRVAHAGDWGWLDFSHHCKGTPLDVHLPESEHQCCHEGCIERTPVQDCVHGEKEVFKTSIRYEYVSIPEVKYRWQMKCITKEIPCDACKTVCETKEVEHLYEAERWDKQQTGCSELHCKTCETKCEKLDTKICKTEPGKTTIKVHYWSCVKVPYTVYRQVRQEVCVKARCHEKVEVPVTRYVCENCCESPVKQVERLPLCP
jgi:hypothetical protein